MKIFFVCDLSKDKRISVFHLIGKSEFKGAKIQINLDHYIIIDTIHENLEDCITSLSWFNEHSINKTLLNLITRCL